MKKRKARLPIIVEILTTQTISSQEQLLKQLADRGYNVTQATLSRDLKMLKTTKVPTEYGTYRYQLVDKDLATVEAHRRETPSLRHSRHVAAISMAFTGNMAVIKTRNGYASGLAYDIDMMKSPLVLGTIPGADTVFVALNETASRQEILDLFDLLLPPSIINAAREHLG